MSQHSCVFNSMVDCETTMHKCLKCGWNPKVKEDRMKKAFEAKPKEQGLLICRK